VHNDSKPSCRAEVAPEQDERHEEDDAGPEQRDLQDRADLPVVA
jgi:hypothetical protein